MIWHVTQDEAGQRLDRHVALRLDETRNRVRRWIEDARVSVDGRPAKPSSPVRAGAAVEVEAPDQAPDAGLEPEDGELMILHEDDDVVVVDKPAGLAVHPGAGRPAKTLANRFLFHYPEAAGIGGPGRPGIVHRLDVDTTGVMVLARSELAYRRLSSAFASRSVEKAYAAIAYGVPKSDRGRIDLPIGRDPNARKKMKAFASQVSPGRGAQTRTRPAVTGYRCLASCRGVSWFELDLETGRTHQIRVHLKAVGHPLVGDPIYGEARWKSLERRVQRPLKGFPRPALHAWRLAFLHPGTQERLEIEAPVPPDMIRLWEQVSGESYRPPLSSF